MDGLKSCLEKKSVTEILKAQKNLSSSITSGRPFLPVVDHKFLYGEFDSVINNCFYSLILLWICSNLSQAQVHHERPKYKQNINLLRSVITGKSQALALMYLY